MLDSGVIPAIFKRSKVVAILKPGKDGSDANHFRPIALLSATYKLFDRLVLERIQDDVDSQLPVEQGGFRHNRGCN